jgi:hypothetical protein
MPPTHRHSGAVEENKGFERFKSTPKTTARCFLGPAHLKAASPVPQRSPTSQLGSSCVLLAACHRGFCGVLSWESTRGLANPLLRPHPTSGGPIGCHSSSPAPLMPPYLSQPWLQLFISTPSSPGVDRRTPFGFFVAAHHSKTRLLTTFPHRIVCLLKESSTPRVPRQWAPFSRRSRGRCWPACS